MSAVCLPADLRSSCDLPTSTFLSPNGTVRTNYLWHNYFIFLYVFLLNIFLLHPLMKKKIICSKFTAGPRHCVRCLFLGVIRIRSGERKRIFDHLSFISRAKRLRSGILLSTETEQTLCIFHLCICLYYLFISYSHGSESVAVALMCTNVRLD